MNERLCLGLLLCCAAVLRDGDRFSVELEPDVVHGSNSNLTALRVNACQPRSLDRAVHKGS